MTEQKITVAKQIKKLEKELDALWKEAVFKVWGEKCGWPGCKYQTRLAIHHFWHRAQGNRARWDVRNGIPLDFYHHIQVVHRQGNTEPIREAIIDKIGLEEFEKLKTLVSAPWKPTLTELEELKEYLLKF